LFVRNEARASCAVSEICSYLARAFLALCTLLCDGPDDSDPEDADAQHIEWEEGPCNEPIDNPVFLGGRDERRGVVPVNLVTFEEEGVMNAFTEG
jgi:hypothetical protein